MVGKQPDKYKLLEPTSIQLKYFNNYKKIKLPFLRHK